MMKDVFISREEGLKKSYKICKYQPVIDYQCQSVLGFQHLKTKQNSAIVFIVSLMLEELQYKWQTCNYTRLEMEIGNRSCKDTRNRPWQYFK